MITRREALMGMIAAASVAAVGLPATAQAAELARNEGLRGFAPWEYEGWDTPTLRWAIFEVDYGRFQAHACLHRDYLAVQWAILNDKAERTAHYQAQAARRIAELVTPANATWQAKGVGMVRELRRRGERYDFPAYTLEDRISYRAFIDEYDAATKGGASDESARVIALRKVGYSWLEACEMVIDEEPFAALVGRTLEAKEMRGDFGDLA